MDISELYPHTNPKLCKWSPDGKYLSTVSKNKLLIRDWDSLQIVQLFTCLGEIQELSWSKDSKFILCGLYKKSMVQVWSLEHPDWSCKIEDSLAGVAHAFWSANSFHILTVSNFQLRVTIWSLEGKREVPQYIKNPKYSPQGSAMAFSNNSKYFAIATRYQSKDKILILSLSNDSWQLQKEFETGTEDLVDIQWAPDDSCIVVWDSPVHYSIIAFSPLDGRVLSRYSAYENALGVKSVSFNKDTSRVLLAVGSYDQKIRILNALTWRAISELSHPSPFTSETAAVYKETEYVDERKYVLESSPVTIPTVRAPIDQPYPKMGVGFMRWSFDGKYLLTRNDNMPNALWVWDISKFSLAALILQKEAVKCARWDPSQNRLAISTGNEYLYLWTPTGTSCVKISLPQFTIANMWWNSQGSSLVLADKDRFCVCWIQVDLDFNLKND